jgi:hypothetical protein
MEGRSEGMDEGKDGRNDYGKEEGRVEDDDDDDGDLDDNFGDGATGDGVGVGGLDEQGGAGADDGHMKMTEEEAIAMAEAASMVGGGHALGSPRFNRNDSEGGREATGMEGVTENEALSPLDSPCNDSDDDDYRPTNDLSTHHELTTHHELSTHHELRPNTLDLTSPAAPSTHTNNIRANMHSAGDDSQSPGEDDGKTSGGSISGLPTIPKKKKKKGEKKEKKKDKKDKKRDKKDKKQKRDQSFGSDSEDFH